MEIRTEQIDGVPVYFPAEATPGPLVAGLLFRVGQADEPLTRRGVTHLVEHLALAPLTDMRSYNGRVSLTTTAFEAEGEPDEIAAFCTRVAEALADLPFDRLDVERRVLRTEDQRGNGSLYSLAFFLRFGPAGPGTVDCPELGLPGATPETVDEWRRRYFTRGNAALWLSGPPPSGLDLSALPEGDRMPPPALEPYPYRYPAWYPGADGYIGVSVLTERSTAAWAVHAILRDRLYDRLREDEGRAYAVSLEYDALSADDAAVFLLTDTLAEEAEHVRDAVAVEIRRLATSGPTAEEIERLVEWRDRRTRDPEFGTVMAARSANEALLDAETASAQELQERLAALDPADAAAALREAAKTALWLVPRKIGMSDRRVHPLPPASDHVVEGETYGRPPGITEELVGDRLVVGPAGMTIVEDDGHLLTVERDGCRAMQVFEDGMRVLWGADGLRVFVHPAVWERGEEAIAAIDACFDPGVVVDMGESSGYDPPIDPERAEAESGGGGLLRRFRRR